MRCACLDLRASLTVDREIWDGPRAGLEGAKEYFGVTTVRSLPSDAHPVDIVIQAASNTELEATLQALAKQAKWMYHDSLTESVVSSVTKANPNLQVGDAEKIIERMRVVKSPAGADRARPFVSTVIAVVCLCWVFLRAHTGAVYLSAYLTGSP